MTRDDELWIGAKQAACHFWDPANDGKVAMRDQVRAIGFMIAFLARWHVPENGCDAFCDDIATAAKGTLADFAKEDAAVEAASAPSTGHGSQPRGGATKADPKTTHRGWGV
jgi:hypothetical protein